MRKENIFQFLIVIIVMTFIGCAKPNNPVTPDTEGKLTLDTFYPSTGYVYDVNVTADRVYAAEDQAGFLIYEHATNGLVTDYYNASYENMRIIQPVEEDSLLFIYVPYGGLQGIRIFDMSDPENIVLASTISGQTTGIFDMQTIRHDDGIEVIWSLDNGDNIIKADGREVYNEVTGIWTWEPGQTEYTFNFEIGKFDATAEYLYVCSEQLGLTILAREEYEAPIVGRVDTKGIPQAVKVVDNFVYIADRQCGLVVIDASDLENPVVVADVETSGYAQELDVEGNLLALASGGGGAYAFDISDPTNPIMIGRITTDEIGYTNDVDIQDGVIYAGTRLGIAKILISEE